MKSYQHIAISTSKSVTSAMTMTITKAVNNKTFNHDFLIVFYLLIFDGLYDCQGHTFISSLML